MIGSDAVLAVTTRGLHYSGEYAVGVTAIKHSVNFVGQSDEAFWKK